jgi:hypothetical protein
LTPHSAHELNDSAHELNDSAHELNDTAHELNDSAHGAQWAAMGWSSEKCFLKRKTLSKVFLYDGFCQGVTHRLLLRLLLVSHLF